MIGTPTCQKRSSHVRGATHTLARRIKLAAASNPLTQARPHNLAELRIGGGTWFPLYPRASVVPPTGRHHEEHVEESPTNLPAGHSSPTPPQIPDASANHALQSRKLGALTWLLSYPSTMVGAPSSRHHRQHVEGVNHAFSRRARLTYTPNPLIQFQTTPWRGGANSAL